MIEKGRQFLFMACAEQLNGDCRHLTDEKTATEKHVRGFSNSKDY